MRHCVKSRLHVLYVVCRSSMIEEGKDLGAEAQNAETLEKNKEGVPRQRAATSCSNAKRAISPCWIGYGGREHCFYD